MPVELPASLQVDGLVLRSVREADYPFLRSVYRDVRRQELAGHPVFTLAPARPVQAPRPVLYLHGGG